MAFDAWGKRLAANGVADPRGQLNPAHGDRGYTGHEHLDEIGLVHMNGRIYDPLLGRFLSPDPVIQAEELLQNYNRYSYVLNNPLRYTDPSGEFWQIVAFIVGAALQASKNENLRLVGSLMMMAAMNGAPAIGEPGLIQMAANAAGYAGTVPGAVTAFSSAFVATTISSGGDIGEGIKSGFFATLTFGVGHGTGLNFGGKVVGHALIGCAQAASSGGKCGPGAMAAAFSKIVSEGLPGDVPAPARAIAAVIAGGTASVIGGGKFANGAIQAGFTFLYNQATAGSGEDEFSEGTPGQQLLRKQAAAGAKAAKIGEAILEEGAVTAVTGGVGGAVARGMSIATRIARGHALEKHLVGSGARVDDPLFRGLGIRTTNQLEAHVANVIQNPTAQRSLSQGRTAYWHDPSSSLVIVDPRSKDMGTIFQPSTGRKYFDDLR